MRKWSRLIEDDVPASLLQEAADEIGRLRRALEAIASFSEVGGPPADIYDAAAIARVALESK
jgi:hypothetical protein